VLIDFRRRELPGTRAWSDLVVAKSKVFDQYLCINSILNHAIRRHSSRNLLLSDSFIPFCQGPPVSFDSILGLFDDLLRDTDDG
jgi:hypothetical protein